jgi:hypothetical protein
VQDDVCDIVITYFVVCIFPRRGHFPRTRALVSLESLLMKI